MITTIRKIIDFVGRNYKMLLNTFLSLSVAFLLFGSINLYRTNKKLSDSLEMVQNNIEAYQESFDDSQQAFSVLKLNMEELQNQKDSVIRELDNVRKKLKIKQNQISTSATQTQTLLVSKSKGVRGQILIKDTIYSDTIKYNDLTTVSYTIGKDTINIGLDIKNKQYLYIYTKREYKNKKNLFKRIFTLDFKKVNKYKYQIVNTNDLLNTSDVRIIESKNK